MKQTSYNRGSYGVKQVENGFQLTFFNQTYIFRTFAETVEKLAWCFELLDASEKIVIRGSLDE